MDTGRIRGGRILLMAVAIAVPVAVVASVPLAQHALKERERLELEERYKDGLSPCERDQADTYNVVRMELPVDDALTVMVFPSFSSPYSVSLSEDAVYYVQMDIVREFPSHGFVCGNAPPGVPSLVAGRPAQRSAMPPQLSEQITALVNEDVKHARAKLPRGLDGTSYVFRTAGGHCAQAWSPSGGTRAETLIDVFHALADRATGKQAHLQESDQAIAAMLEQVE